MALPSKPVTWFRQILNNTHFFSERNIVVIHYFMPMFQQHTSIEMVKETQISKKSTC